MSREDLLAAGALIADILIWTYVYVLARGL